MLIYDEIILYLYKWIFYYEIKFQIRHPIITTILLPPQLICCIFYNSTTENYFFVLKIVINLYKVYFIFIELTDE